MIRIPFADLVSKIIEKTGLPESEVLSKIEEKQRQLSGLISKDGSAHIVANELGVRLFEHGSRLKIKDIYPEMRSVEFLGKVVQIFPAREFIRADNSTGLVGNVLLGDETGQIRVVCWGRQAELLEGISIGDILKITNAIAKENRNATEVHLNDNSRIFVNPEKETVGPLKEPDAARRKEIRTLSEGDSNIEIIGTIIQVYDLKFFETCPGCNKRLRQDFDQWICETHGNTSPQYSFVLNLILDDGRDTIRVVLFRRQVEKILNKSYEEILAFRNSTEGLEAVKNSLLGEVFRFQGRVDRNSFFDRLEFRAQQLFQVSREELAEMQAVSRAVEEPKGRNVSGLGVALQNNSGIGDQWSLDSSAQGI